MQPREPADQERQWSRARPPDAEAPTATVLLPSRPAVSTLRPDHLGPPTLSSTDVLALQRTLGNSAVNALLRPGTGQHATDRAPVQRKAAHDARSPSQQSERLCPHPSRWMTSQTAAAAACPFQDRNLCVGAERAPARSVAMGSKAIQIAAPAAPVVGPAQTSRARCLCAAARPGTSQILANPASAAGNHGAIRRYPAPGLCRTRRRIPRYPFVG
jgi:hypothetical protein